MIPTITLLGCCEHSPLSLAYQHGGLKAWKGTRDTEKQSLASFFFFFRWALLAGAMDHFEEVFLFQH